MSISECRKLSNPTFEATNVGVPHRRGITNESVGATGISMHVVTIPAGGRALAHRHDYEEVLYVVSGMAEMWWGRQLENCMECAADELIFIPSACPHLAINRSERTPVIAVVARADPFADGNAVLMPELDRMVR